MTIRITKSEDEKSVVVHSTTQPDEYQLLEKRTQDKLPIRYLGRLQTVIIVYLVHSSIIHGLVLLAKSSTSRQPYPKSCFTYSVSKGARQLILLETLVLKVSAVTLSLSLSLSLFLMFKSQLILT